MEQTELTKKKSAYKPITVSFVVSGTNTVEHLAFIFSLLCVCEEINTLIDELMCYTVIFLFIFLTQVCFETLKQQMFGE